jgi:sarcosine oxidase
MALWQASKHSSDVVGFEAITPGHGRSAVGGDSRLFRMTYREGANIYPILQKSRELWLDLEAESGHEILNKCGGLAIGTVDGPYIPKLLKTTHDNNAPHQVLGYDEMAERYPQHNLRRDDVAVFDPNAGFLRTDRAVTSAVAAARKNGATVVEGTPIDDIRETPDGVLITSGDSSWTFEKAIVAAGAWSTHLLPKPIQANVHPRRIFLTWFVAKHPEIFAPERFPIFIRISGNRDMYGAPTVDGTTVKTTLDGRSILTTEDPSALNRELTPAAVEETLATVKEFFPDLVPSITRSDVYPDLYTTDQVPIVGQVPGSHRITYATGFSGSGFKMSTGYGALAAQHALGQSPFYAPDFLSPTRFP